MRFLYNYQKLLFLTMKQAKQDILEIPYKETLYLVSIVEKQNDSGIMFNDRIFFLQPGKCIGYISEVKIDQPASKISFEKPKLTVPISQLKTFAVNERELHIKATQTDGTRRLEKDWNLRLATPLLAKMWYDRLQREKVFDTAKKSSPKIQKNVAQELRAKVEQSKISPPRKSMQIIRSESFTFNIKPDIERVETGVGVAPVQTQSSFKRNIIQTRQVGTIMSQKAESLSSSQHRESPQKRQLSKKQLTLIQTQAANRQIQNSTITNKIMQREPQNEGITDRSFAEPIINKSVNSEPVNRNIESFKPNRKDEKLAINPQEANTHEKISSYNENKSDKNNNSSLKEVDHKLEQSGPDMIRLEHEIKSKDNMNLSEVLRKTVEKQAIIPDDKSSKPQSQSKQEKLINSSGIKSIKSLKKQEGEKLAKEQLLFSHAQQATALNNKKYITSQEFQKLNTSTPLNYFDRTSHLIKGSSHHQQLPEQSIHSKSSSHESQKREEIVKSPSNKKLQEGKPSTPRESSNLKFSILEVKEEYQQCNESQQLHQIIQDEYSSIIVQQEKSEPLKEPLTWTCRYLQFGDAVFNEFKDFSQQLMQELIEDLKLPAQQQLFKKKQVRNNIITYHIDDVQAKIAIINIEEIPSETEAKFKEKVCNRKAIKALKNEFNNYHLLYQHLEPACKLKVPLICLCEVNGFIGLFKVLSKSMEKQIRMRDIECEIEDLKGKTKINSNFYHNHNRNIIQLDSQFYRSMDKNAKQSLSCFFLQELEDYLLPDCLSDQQNQQNLGLLRKQLIFKFAEDPAIHESSARNKPISKLLERTVKEAQKISKNLLKVLSQVIVEIDSLSVYFFSSSQLGDYLHKKGVNVRYLGHIYEHSSTTFQKRVLMSEIAARSCKSLFRKTLQDIILEEEALSMQSIILKSCDFLNCVTSSSFETAAIWKVLSSHSVAYFGVELDFNCIEKGYFLISLIQNCRLDVLWEMVHPLDVFKDNMLFTEKNFLGLIPLVQTYLPFHNHNYAVCSKILQQPHSQDGLSQLLSLVKSSACPSLFTSLQSQIKQYISLFVSPYRAKEQQLGIALYEHSQKVKPCRSYFDLLLMEIKWYLKYKDRENYIQKCDQFIRVATKYFGEFHPIFSELYDLFSSYHLSNLEFQDSITFAKSSLVNILKVCGTSHDKTSECYYNLALCYIKAGKKEQAFAHMKKAKLIFENSGRSSSVPYAIISLKLALIYLNQDQPKLCLAAAVASLQILESESLSCYEDELVDCYEMITRCYQIMQEKAKIQQIADKCETQLCEINSPHNLERALKIIIYPILSQASPENASIFLDIISQLSLEPNSDYYTFSAESLKLRTKEGTLVRNLQEYLSNVLEIEAFMRESNFMAGWQSFKESYARETVSDFVALTEELLVFLGEGFVSGSLREAL